MATFLTLVKLLAGALLLYTASIFFTPKKTEAQLPPGPRRKPLVGNITDLPPAGKPEWEHWLKHKELYGPISSVTVLGTTIIIVSDAKLAIELMEKRSAIHSSRPRMIFGGEMCGWENLLAGQYYNERFRAFRKAIHSVMGTKAAVARFFPVQDIEVRRFLLRALESPENLVQHLRTEAGAIILKIAYGYTIEPHKRDHLVDTADEALAQFSAAIVPGAWMVDMIPALRFLPDWAPGTAFKRTARAWRATLTETAEKPYAFVKQQMADKHYEPSYVSSIFNKAEKKMTAEEEYVTKWSAASLYTGGADTSVSSMSSFFLAMTVNPEVQLKAQEEIDRVIGTDRLPGFDDRSRLPFVDAVVQETFRWHPIAPMGLPHMTSQDDTYEGYLIPKDAIMIPNIWLFTHDPSVYEDPMSFKPERFLGPNPAPDPQNYVFGFGRRICAGKILADSSVWLTIAQSLAVFTIGKAIDKDGKEIEPVVKFQPGIISHPVPFQASIKPRSAKHEALIRSIEAEHPWEKSHAEHLESIRI